MYIKKTPDWVVMIQGEIRIGSADHSRRIVALCRSIHSRPRAPCFGSFASQKRYFIVFARSPLPGTGKVQISTSRTKKEQTRLGLFFFLAEKERFELSRRLMPAYTLSRGASSANLSTSPYLCKSPFLKLALLLYPIFFRLSISFLRNFLFSSQKEK